LHKKAFDAVLSEITNHILTMQHHNIDKIPSDEYFSEARWICLDIVFEYYSINVPGKLRSTPGVQQRR
jgi:hypothetical protein